MYSVPGDTTSLVPGFPIRTSSDPRSVGSSPRHIAASHVLHRLSVPRHPPCALKHLQHKTKKMSHHPHTPPKECMRVSEKFALHAEHTRPTKTHCAQMLATTIHKSNTTPHHQSRATTNPPTPHRGQRKNGLLSQSPIVCLMVILTDISQPARQVCCCTRRASTTETRHPTNRLNHRTPTRCGRAQVSWCSLERR